MRKSSPRKEREKAWAGFGKEIGPTQNENAIKIDNTMTTNNLWEDNSRKSNKPMTIEHAGTRYIGIPEEELRAMNKELKELRAKSKSYDTYLDSIGKVWLGTIDTLLDEAQEKWLKENAYKVYTAPHPNTLKGVAMQMPYTFDGLTDGSKTTMPEVDEKGQVEEFRHWEQKTDLEVDRWKRKMI